MPECQFCTPHDVYREFRFFWAKLDPFPVSKGHALFIPKRHVDGFTEMNNYESVSYFSQLKEVIDSLWRDYRFDGYNIGINNGAAAGRTIHHLHTHIIPRYKGDVADPRGGVRNLMPGAPHPNLWSKSA